MLPVIARTGQRSLVPNGNGLYETVNRRPDSGTLVVSTGCIPPVIRSAHVLSVRAVSTSVATDRDINPNFKGERRIFVPAPRGRRREICRFTLRTASTLPEKTVVRTRLPSGEPTSYGRRSSPARPRVVPRLHRDIGRAVRINSDGPSDHCR